jgi:hypothetical protein
MTHYQYKNTSFASTLCTGVKNRHVTRDEEPKESVRFFSKETTREKAEIQFFKPVYKGH